MVSVIISAYNYGIYLRDCLESVLNQTYPDFEIIIINDCSTDHTNEIVQPYLTDSRINYVNLKTNQGQSRVKNTGVDLVRGEFVAFLDADDKWHKEKLEKQMKLFIDPEVGIVYSNFYSTDSMGNNPKIIAMKKARGWLSQALFYDNFICFSSSVVRAKCLLEMGAFNTELQMGVDWDLWLRLSTKYKFDYVDEPLGYYREGHSNQMSKNLEMRFKCAEKIMADFYSKHPNLIPANIYKKAYSFTWRTRFNYYASRDAKKALGYFIKAVICNPLELANYVNALVVLYRKLLR